MDADAPTVDHDDGPSTGDVDRDLAAAQEHVARAIGTADPAHWTIATLGELHAHVIRVRQTLLERHET